MASHIVFYEHPITGAVEKAPVGFSWTTLFFGVWPAVFRGNWKWATIMFLLVSLEWVVFASAGQPVVADVLILVTWLFFTVKYNSLWTNDLIKKGFKRLTGQPNQNITINNTNLNNEK